MCVLVCMCVHACGEICCKDSAYMIMVTGVSKICTLSQELETLEELILQLKSDGV